MHLLKGCLVVAGLVQAAFSQATDRKCQRDMCVEATVQNNSTVLYSLTLSQPAQSLGWMALGFGRSMLNTPLVVMWQSASTGDVVVSQRQARTYSQPQVVDAPERVASAVDSLTEATSSSTTFAFEVPHDGTNGNQNVVWAYSTAPIEGTGVGATISVHDDNGSVRLNLSSGTTDNGNNTGNQNDDDEDDPNAWTSRQKMIFAHGILCTLGFIVILPVGALTARLGRTFIPGRIWFAIHWICQWPLSGLLIVIGAALAIAEIQEAGKTHFNTPHRRIGIILIVLWVVQCTLGGIIHFIKKANRKSRPPQNYVHAILGIAIIGLAFWQVFTGMEVEWIGMGLGPVSQTVFNLWVAWAIIIPVLYFGGLIFLKRQYTQEKEQREKSTEDQWSSKERYADSPPRSDVPLTQPTNYPTTNVYNNASYNDSNYNNTSYTYNNTGGGYNDTRGGYNPNNYRGV